MVLRTQVRIRPTRSEFGCERRERGESEGLRLRARAEGRSVPAVRAAPVPRVLGLSSRASQHSRPQPGGLLPGFLPRPLHPPPG
jgi:hypothetical protein